MTEIKRLWQHRRDFKALYRCESCGTEKEHSGYDDENFHLNVVPDIKCFECNESTKSLKLQAVDNTLVPKGAIV